MEIQFDTVLERDMDLLIMEEFLADQGFAKIFLDAAEIHKTYTVEKVIHSKMDLELGESDIVFILNIDGKKHALHIEDKINAIAMLMQHDRYFMRGNKEVSLGEYDSFSVVLTAPEKYLSVNAEAQKYKYQVPYEDLLSFFQKKTDVHAEYKIAVLSKALDENKNAYKFTESDDVVRFCTAMHAYQKENYPNLTLGSVAWWSYIKTSIPNVQLVYKANKGFCDLQFSNCSKERLYPLVKDLIASDMFVVKASKSAAIRMEVPPVAFEDDFEIHIEDVDRALYALSKLYELSKKLRHITF